mmetsp:Transcript_20519/g.37012  ORF Transcript_20519/g.37012 Transcript_20519/m.37012 type:complete len:443 (-) Transcript_20519:180-1508(-)|eukprot:CAMPEP_0201883196 /NCGR_PEP_ID=MMETSP0902-20130614/15205_1 /ASSEMBLY_ACC=CAM_ASM_000551 /TAXON_ID=420261 /ORGANISM="Thalassiosira antarctica, Strain CCMP982" /LENGTH=442 /DNA_ID=CAMNT_0048411929 /DNA_START=93 /DNA_END=1421 /DNA_ORIENTATION=-
MEQMNNMNNNGSGDNSPNPNHNPNRGMMNFNDGPSAASFAGGHGGQMMNPMAFMAQFPGMMGNMPNNPQDMMNMMGAYCQTANGGPGNMGAYGGYPNDGQNPQGMNPQAMAQMMGKRSMPMEDYGDDDVQPPAAKRANYGTSPADMAPHETEEASGGNVHGSSDSIAPAGDDDDDDCKPSATSDLASRKEHAVILPSKEGIKFYSRNDVLCGRGGGTNVHPGNRRFRDLINANRRAYLKARKNDKPAISRSIVRTIREMNGRFLKKDEKLGLWFEIGDDGAREKTSQALRQRAPEMRKILFEDEQRVQQQQQQELMQRHQLMGMGGQGMQGMQGMGGNFSQMGPAAASMGGNMGNFAASMGGPQASGNSSNPNSDLSQSLLAKYNMLHQKNWLAQEKNMILQRLAMSGINPNSLNNTQNNIENMTTQTLLQQGIKPVTPRGA